MGEAKGIDWDEALEARLGMSLADIARDLGVHQRTVEKARKRRPWLQERARAARLGQAVEWKPEAPHSDARQPVLPDRHIVKGVSTYVRQGKNGQWEAAAQWIKTREDREQFIEAIKRIGEDAKRQSPPPVFEPIAGPDDTLLVCPWGDPHIGMLSWAMETGQRWTLRGAEEVHVETTRRLIERAPDAGRLLLIGMGDNLHVNSRKAQTPGSGHLLDVDSRYPEMMHVAQRTFRRAIQAALERVFRVDVVILSGNHDPDAAWALAYMLACYFHNEPRVRIDLRPTKYRSYVWGRSLIGLAHGDTRRVAQMSGLMTSEWPDLVGRCAWRMWYTGHLHHEVVRTLDDGARVTQVETLAARDAYASEGGWASRRSVSCHVWDRLGGHVASLHERIPHHRATRLAPESDVVGWDDSDSLSV